MVVTGEDLKLISGCVSDVSEDKALEGPGEPGLHSNSEVDYDEVLESPRATRVETTTVEQGQSAKVDPPPGLPPPTRLSASGEHDETQM